MLLCLQFSVHYFLRSILEFSYLPIKHILGKLLFLYFLLMHLIYNYILCVVEMSKDQIVEIDQIVQSIRSVKSIFLSYRRERVLFCLMSLNYSKTYFILIIGLNRLISTTTPLQLYR